MTLDKPAVFNDLFHALKKEADEMLKKFKEEREKLDDAELFIVGQKADKLMRPQQQIRSRRCLKGHTGKVLDVDWSMDKRKIVSSSQDGKVIVFDAFANSKENVITLPTTWVNACAFSPSGMFIACGGLDNKCSIYPSSPTVNVASNGANRQTSISSENASGKYMQHRRVVAMHTGYVSACSFTDSDHQILTASGDNSCRLWDVESSTVLQTLHGHEADVLDAELCPTNKANCFVSGGGDRTARVWDIRQGKCNHLYKTSQSDINAVRWMPTGEGFATGSDDGTIRLYDIRADREISVYAKPSVFFAVNDLDFSLSGRVIFAAYNDYLVHVWDTVKGTKITALFGHDNRASCLRTSPDGLAFATGSWDATIRIWA